MIVRLALTPSRRREYMNDQNNLRIIVIDDNPAIHQDFIKILTTDQFHSKLDVLDEQLFGSKNSSQDSALPFFQIDTALQGQDGVQQIKKALEENQQYAM